MLHFLVTGSALPALVQDDQTDGEEDSDSGSSDQESDQASDAPHVPQGQARMPEPVHAGVKDLLADFNAAASVKNSKSRTSDSESLPETEPAAEAEMKMRASEALSSGDKAEKTRETCESEGSAESDSDRESEGSGQEPEVPAKNEIAGGNACTEEGNGIKSEDETSESEPEGDNKAEERTQRQEENEETSNSEDEPMEKMQEEPEQSATVEKVPEESDTSSSEACQAGPTFSKAVPKSEIERENQIRERLGRFNEEQLTRMVARVKEHLEFSNYMDWVKLELGEIDVVDYGAPDGDILEDLVSWELWLGDPRRLAAKSARAQQDTGSSPRRGWGWFCKREWE